MYVRLIVCHFIIGWFLKIDLSLKFKSFESRALNGDCL